ncbi:MAG: helix-turn-helix transcriptional regulator [Anaerolineae bacterium]|nr:helix-turn-helix transcriptional regulator [Anaerolineae bacterium]
MTQQASPDVPCYTIGVVARLVKLHPQTLRNYEQMGLVVPHRSDGNIRLYSQEDVETLHKINRLTQELGINLAGVEVILHMTSQIEMLRIEIDTLQQQLANSTT